MDYISLLNHALANSAKQIVSKNSSLTEEFAKVYTKCWNYSISDKVDIPNKSISFLTELRNHYRDLPNGLLGSNMHLVWLLARLSRDGILERPKDLMSMAYDVVNRNSLYYTNSPIQIDVRQRFYPIGVGMISLHDSSDSISRYAWEEQIIFKLCDCEKFLTTEIAHLYSPMQLTAGILHSVIAFSNLALKYKIYPFKALRINDLASSLEYDVAKSNSRDMVILDIMCERLLTTDLASFDEGDWCCLLSEGGMLSMIYEDESMFAKLLELAEEFYPGLIERIEDGDLYANYLPGITMGLINLVKDYETEY